MLLWLPLLAFAGALELQAAQSEAISTPRTTVRLITDSDIAIPGSSLGAGLDFELAEGWHVYWRNPGDSGLPPKLNWDLADGWSTTGIAWPVPERIPVGPFVNFGYSDRVLIADRLQVPANAVLGDSVTLRLDAEWLVCEEACIPEEGSFEIQLPIASAAFAAAQEAKHFRATEDLLPREMPNVEASLKSMDDGRLEVRIQLPTALPLDPEQIFLFPATESVVEPSAPQQVRLDGKTLIFDLQRSAYAAKTLQGLEALVVAEGTQESRESQDANEQPLAFPIAAKAVDAEAISAGSAAQSLNSDEGGESRSGLPLGLPAALAFAFVGGLLLNLMPCVFPVISIKVLSFLEGAENSSRSRRHGWLFALGVLLSFQLLAALLLVLRGAGEEIGWGFHLQSPPVLGLLSLLFFLAGLSFLGVFEVGSLVAGRAARLSSRAQLSPGGSGAWSAFGSGALATVVATPCTAPFMGPALGLALVLSPLQALAIFSALGAGMAAPYLLLAHLPQLAQRLPAPGPWMETLKQVLAFPLFATVVWLAWVLAGISGPTGVLGLLIALLLAGFGAWFLGRFGAVTAPPQRRRWVFAGAIATVALAVASVIPGVILPATAATTTTVGAAGEGELPWLDFRPGLVEELRAEGRAVYVDFTAAWCLTCQVNKTVVFSSDEVRETFQQRDIALVRADWTRRNPDITRALSAFGRSGVPLNVYYPPQQSMSSEVPPKVLPTVLTPGLVLDAIAEPANS